MKKISGKSGASMVLALVFLLFCTFVGGSVLTAATANASRLAHMADEQAYLDQRSAALLMVDELKYPDTKPLRLEAFDTKYKVQEVEVTPEGNYQPVSGGVNTTVRKVIFSIPQGYIANPMQRLLYESAVYRYVKANGVVYSDVQLDSVIYQNGTPADPADDYEVSQIASFWLSYDISTPDVAGEISVKGKVTQPGAAQTQFADFPARFSCADGSEEIYDFNVDFGSFSQLNVHMDGYCGQTTTPPSSSVQMVTLNGRTFQAQVDITDATHTLISWVQPRVFKGGV